MLRTNRGDLLISYLISLVLLIITLIVVPKEAFKINRLMAITSILFYFSGYLAVLYFHSRLPRLENFVVFDGIIFGIIIYLTLYRQITIPLVQQRDLIEFEIIYRMVLLFLFGYYLIFRNIPVKISLCSRPGDWINTIIFTFLLIVVNLIIALKFNFLEFHVRKINIKESFVLSVYMFFFVALTQEIFFRGLVFSYLKHFYPGKDLLIPLLLSAVIFGIAHLKYGGRQLFYLATIAGIFYGIIFVLTNNIFFPTLCHMIVNIFWKVLLRPKSFKFEKLIT